MNVVNGLVFVVVKKPLHLVDTVNCDYMYLIHYLILTSLSSSWKRRGHMVIMGHQLCSMAYWHGTLGGKSGFLRLTHNDILQ